MKLNELVKYLFCNHFTIYYCFYDSGLKLYEIFDGEFSIQFDKFLSIYEDFSVVGIDYFIDSLVIFISDENVEKEDFKILLND